MAGVRAVRPTVKRGPPGVRAPRCGPAGARRRPRHSDDQGQRSGPLPHGEMEAGRSASSPVGRAGRRPPAMTQAPVALGARGPRSADGTGRERCWSTATPARCSPWCPTAAAQPSNGRVEELTNSYEGLAIALVDAAIVIVAGRLAAPGIATLNYRGFNVVRPSRRFHFMLRPAAAADSWRLGSTLRPPVRGA